MLSSSGRTTRGFALALSLSLVAGSARAEDPQTPAPQKPPAEKQAPNPYWMLTTGASIFAVAYIASAAAATTGFENPAAGTNLESSRASLWVPLGGPFMQLNLTSSGGEKALLILDGFAQLTGYTLFIAGLAKHDILANSPKSNGVAIAPLVAPHVEGFAITGRF